MAHEHKTSKGSWILHSTGENGGTVALKIGDRRIYSNGNTKVKAFAIAIREDGKEKFITHIVRNIGKGRSVEKGKDFDGKPVDEVLAMLREQ